MMQHKPVTAPATLQITTAESIHALNYYSHVIACIPTWGGGITHTYLYYVRDERENA